MSIVVQAVNIIKQTQYTNSKYQTVCAFGVDRVALGRYRKHGIGVKLTLLDTLSQNKIKQSTINRRLSVEAIIVHVRAVCCNCYY